MDDTGAALRGDATYVVTVPAGLYNPGGYFSVTLYGTDNKLLIPNDLKIYDRTSHSLQSRTKTEQQPSLSVRMGVEKTVSQLGKTSMGSFVRTCQHLGLRCNHESEGCAAVAKSDVGISASSND